MCIPKGMSGEARSFDGYQYSVLCVWLQPKALAILNEAFRYINHYEDKKTGIDACYIPCHGSVIRETHHEEVEISIQQAADALQYHTS